MSPNIQKRVWLIVDFLIDQMKFNATALYSKAAPIIKCV
jgi:hypothetical protein